MSAGSTALCVATSASTASAISRRCCALYLSSGAYALCWNRSWPRSVRAPSCRSLRFSLSGEEVDATALHRHWTPRGRRAGGGEPAREGREGRRHRRVPKSARRKSRGAEMETENPRGSGSRAKINRLRFVDSADASPRAVTRRREGWRTGGTNCGSAGAENASHNARHADASSREPRRSSVILGRLASAKARERGPNRSHLPAAGSPGDARGRTTQRRAVQKRERHELAVPEGVHHPRWVPHDPQAVHPRGARRPSDSSRRPAPRVPRPRELRSRSRNAQMAPIHSTSRATR